MMFINRNQEDLTIIKVEGKTTTKQYEMFRICMDERDRITYKMEKVEKDGTQKCIIIVGLQVSEPNIAHFRFVLEDPNIMGTLPLQDRIAIDEAIAILNRKYGAY